MRFDTGLAGASAYSVADASVDERASFIVKTYLHLVAAIFAFALLETALIVSGIGARIVPFMIGGRFSWLIVLGAFIGVSWLADAWARNSTSKPMQYAGLGLYVLAQAVIFLPMIMLAAVYDPNAIPTAGIVTLAVFAALTGVVFVTRKDFSFLRGVLAVASIGALITIGCAIVFDFSLGVFFSGAMIVLAAGAILYNTSNVLHHYRTDQYVAAALTLFADVALMFWYVLRIFMGRGND